MAVFPLRRLDGLGVGLGGVAERLLLRLLALLGASAVLSKDGARIAPPLGDRFLGFRSVVAMRFFGLPSRRIGRGGFGRGLLHPSQSNTA